MWFKQFTCDSCFRPMRNTGRHNRFFFTKIIDYFCVSKFEYHSNPHIYQSADKSRFNFPVPNGNVYCYVTEPFNPNGFNTWYCSPECAVKEAKRNNCILYYFDEKLGVAAALTPQIESINKERGYPLYSGLPMYGITGDKWIVPKSQFDDYSQFGFDTSFPKMNLTNSNLVKPTLIFEKENAELYLNPDFQKSFFGSNNQAAVNHIKEGLVNSIQKMEINFGRRMQIDWFVIDKDNKYAGFIRLTSMSPSLPYKWVLEFGLNTLHRKKGIMIEAVTAVLKWARHEGCDIVYAISEDFNVPCHKLMNKLPFNVDERRTTMTDPFAGYRPMRLFTIK